jgi:putative endonuclease
MYYVYVLRSKNDGNFYVGHTSDLSKRMEQHSKGVVESTRNRRPLELIYYEACAKQQDALRREKYLKTTYGRRYIRNRLKEYLDEFD